MQRDVSDSSLGILPLPPLLQLGLIPASTKPNQEHIFFLKRQEQFFDNLLCLCAKPLLHSPIASHVEFLEVGDEETLGQDPCLLLLSQLGPIYIHSLQLIDSSGQHIWIHRGEVVATYPQYLQLTGCVEGSKDCLHLLGGQAGGP